MAYSALRVGIPVKIQIEDGPDHNQIAVEGIFQAVLLDDFFGTEAAAVDTQIFENAVPEDEDKHNEHAENNRETSLRIEQEADSCEHFKCGKADRHRGKKNFRNEPVGRYCMCERFRVGELYSARIDEYRSDYKTDDPVCPGRRHYSLHSGHSKEMQKKSQTIFSIIVKLKTINPIDNLNI